MDCVWPAPRICFLRCYDTGIARRHLVSIAHVKIEFFGVQKTWIQGRFVWTIHDYLVLGFLKYIYFIFFLQNRSGQKMENVWKTLFLCHHDSLSYCNLCNFTACVVQRFFCCWWKYLWKMEKNGFSLWIFCKKRKISPIFNVRFF